MADKIPTSFSPARRVGIAFNVLVRTALVLMVLVLAVHLSKRHFHRAYLSTHTRFELSPRTVNFVKSITNQVKVILYFDRDQEMYSTVSALLAEYRNINPGIKVQTVDFNREPAEAARIKSEYKLADSQGENDKNLVIFDCDGRKKVVNAHLLQETAIEEVPNPKEREYRRKPVAFRGEMIFTAMLLTVTQPKPMQAMFLTGHGEHRLEDSDPISGYQKFALVLQQNYITNTTIRLGTNAVPADCNLLVIAGPTKPLSETELETIRSYLDEGGRMLVMFNPEERTHQTGLERLLVRYDLLVAAGAVIDSQNTDKGSDVIVAPDVNTKHPLVNALLGYGIQMILPRPLKAMNSQKPGADVKVEEVLFSSGAATLLGERTSKPARYCTAAVIEKGAVPGVATARGATRILVLGDSTMFVNTMIEKWSNRDFAGFAANWLLDRTQLLEGVSPRPVTEFRITMTQEQMRRCRWLLLGAVPGTVLAFGGLVWLRRRK